jgi:hypothetical protein
MYKIGDNKKVNNKNNKKLNKNKVWKDHYSNK